MSLTNNEIERYSRQIILKDIGVSGQKKLKKSKVLLIMIKLIYQIFIGNLYLLLTIVKNIKLIL